MREIFWDRNDGHCQMMLVPVGFKLKTEDGQVTLPLVFWVHAYPGYCPRLTPMSDQCYGTQQPSLLTQVVIFLEKYQIAKSIFITKRHFCSI